MIKQLKKWWRLRGYVVISEHQERYVISWCRTRKQASELASQYNDDSLFGGGWYSFYLPAKTLDSYLAKRERQWRLHAG